MIVRILVAAVIWTGSTGSAFAEPLEAMFERANQAYFQGNYERAILDYERLLAAGVEDADVEFNLATSFAQRGQIGRAIQHFERALTLRPGDDQAQAGLDGARTLLAARRADAEGEAVIEDARSFGETLVAPFSEAALAYALLVAEAVFFGVWFLRRRRTPHSAHALGLGVALGVVGCAALLLASGLLVKRGVFAEGARVIVLDDHVPLREGPDPRAGERGEAREGEPATLLDVDQRFVHVRLSGGREGWLEADRVGRI